MSGMPLSYGADFAAVGFVGATAALRPSSSIPIANAVPSISRMTNESWPEVSSSTRAPSAPAAAVPFRRAAGRAGQPLPTPES